VPDKLPVESWDVIDGRGIGDFDREGRGGIIGGVAMGIVFVRVSLFVVVVMGER
jgi:hypothetical protein